MADKPVTKVQKARRNWKCNPKYSGHEDCPGIWAIHETGESGLCSCPCHRLPTAQTIRAADISKSLPNEG